VTSFAGVFVCRLHLAMINGSCSRQSGIAIAVLGKNVWEKSVNDFSH